MTRTFLKVGDKVRHETYGDVELAFGPVNFQSFTGGWLVKLADGDHAVATPGALSPVAKFKVGDQTQGVRTGQHYTIEAGPFFDPSEWYVTRKENGDVTSTHARNMNAAESAAADPVKVGDVVRVSRDSLQGADVKEGDLLVVKYVSDGGDLRVHAAPGARQATWYFHPTNVQKVPADEATVLDGMVYDLTAKYRDRDGDYWTFKNIDGTVRGHCAGTVERTVTSFIGVRSDTLAEAVTSYGPLTRV